MAPNVPFALVGVVQLTAVAGWLGLAGTATLPWRRDVRGAATIVGALCLAVSDAVVPLQFGSPVSGWLGGLRIGGLALLALAAWFALAGNRRPRVEPTAASGIVVPLGAAAAPSLVAGALGVVAAGLTVARNRAAVRELPAGSLVVAALALGLAFTGAAAALADPAGRGGDAALAELAARAAATAAILLADVLLARTALVGKLVGAIVAGVVAMAVGAVAVAGTGVASEVQSQQSARLLSVARSQLSGLRSLQSRALLNAQVVVACPTSPAACRRALGLFASTPNFFAYVDAPGHPLATVAARDSRLTSAQQLSLAGTSVVRSALRRGVSAAGVAGPLLLSGRPDVLAIVAAVPGRPRGVSSVTVKPTYAAVYGIGLVSAYLRTLRASIGYDVSVIADGHVVASSLRRPARRQLMTAAAQAGVALQGASGATVVPAAGASPTVALVPIVSASNGDVRLATLAISQPANEALAAQRSVLRRLVLTALAVLLLVALAAVVLARRIADPVRRLTVAAGRVRGGDLDTAIAVSSSDEVGALARAFDTMTGSLRGLTGELRAAAEAEAATRARLETVVAAMTDGVVAADAAGAVTSANVEALRLLGFSTDDGTDGIVGRPVAEVARIVRDGQPVELHGRLDTEAELLRDDETRVAVRVAVAPLPADGGSVVTLVDRSREREVERMKTEFLANVSHELRTPLTPIKGYAELLARRPGMSPEQVDRFAGEILTSTDRMTRVVALLVDVAALDAGRVVPVHQATPVGELLEPALAAWRTRWPDRADDLRRSVARGVPAVDVDPEWVRKALTELVDNAVKVTTPGARITIRAELAGAASANGRAKRVRVKVVDRGPGIEPGRVNDLISDFSQADASETRKLAGLGLGLGFVRRVCEQFDIDLYVESTPGRGSEWGLDLPVAGRGKRGRSPRRTAHLSAAERS